MKKFTEKLLTSVLVASMFVNSISSVTFANDITPDELEENSVSVIESYEPSDETTNGIEDIIGEEEINISDTELGATDDENLDNIEDLEKSELDKSETEDEENLELEKDLVENENKVNLEKEENFKNFRTLSESPTTFSEINSLISANSSESEFSFTGSITADETIYLDRDLTFDFNGGTITVNDAKVLFENSNTNAGHNLTIKNANFVSNAPADTNIIVFNTAYVDSSRNFHLTVDNSKFSGFKRGSIIGDRWRDQRYNNCEFTGNSADALGLSYMYIQESWSSHEDFNGTAGKITINNCNVHDNEIGKYGLFSPGIRFAGELHVTDSTFENNISNGDSHNDDVLTEYSINQNINNVFNIVSRGYSHTKVDIKNTSFINNEVSGTVINMIQERNKDIQMAYSWFLDSYSDVKVSADCIFTGNSSQDNRPVKLNLNGEGSITYNGYATMYSAYKNNIGKLDRNGEPVFDNPIEGGEYKYLYNNVDMRVIPMNIVKFEPVPGKPTLDIADQYIISNGKITMPTIKSGNVVYHIGDTITVGGKEYILKGLAKVYSNKTDIEIPQNELVAWDFENDTTADWSEPGFEFGEAIVLVPIWYEPTGNEIEVKFVANNGDLDNQIVSDAQADSLIDKPAGFPTEYDDKFFYGWNTKADGTGEYWNFEEDKSGSSNMELYGIWIDISPRVFEAVIGDTLAETINLNNDLLAKFGFGNPFAVTLSQVTGSFGWGSNDKDAEFTKIGQEKYTLTFTDDFGTIHNFEVKVNVKGTLNNAFVNIAQKPYNGQLQTISSSDIQVISNGETLVEGVDYTFSVPNDANMFDAGSTVVTIEGIGNYKDSTTKNYVITKIDPTLNADTNPSVDSGTTFNDYLNLIKSNGTLTATGVGREISNLPGEFTWKTATGTAAITDGEYILVFTPSSSNTDTSGTHIGNYNVKEITLNFVLNQTPLSEDMITGMVDVPYKGESYESKKPVLKDGSYTLIEGVDYTLTATPTNDYVNVGTVEYKINGIGAYKNPTDGALVANFDITKATPTVSDVDANKVPTSWTYQNLIEDLIASNKLEAIGVTADGKLSGGTFTITSGESATDLVEISENKTITVLFTPSTADSRNYNTQTAIITLKDFNIPTIKVAKLEDVVYNGYEQKQNPVVTIEGGAIVPVAFYDVSYSTDVVNANTVTVTVTGKERVEGTVVVTYKITKATPTVANIEVDNAKSTHTYSTLLDELDGDGKIVAMGVDKDGQLNKGTYKIVLESLIGELLSLDSSDNEFEVDFYPHVNDAHNYVNTRFTIKIKALEKVDISAYEVEGLTDVIYNALEQKQVPVVKDDLGNELEIDKDFEVTYDTENFIDCKKITVNINGIGRYEGTITKEYSINKADTEVLNYDAKNVISTWTNAELLAHLVKSGKIFATGLIESRPTLADGKFELSGSDGLVTANSTFEIKFIPSNIDSVNYNETVATIKIINTTVPDISDDDLFDISEISDVTFNGDAHKYEPVITTITGYTLIKDKDYTLTYDVSDFVNAGAINITVKGIDKYIGEVNVNYNILQDNVSPTFAVTEGETPSGSAIFNETEGTSFTYNTNKPLATGDITVTYDNKKGVSGTLEVTSLENGVAIIEWKPFLANGVYEIKASYDGDRNYIKPSDQIIEYVIKSNAEYAFGVSGVVSPMLYTGNPITQDNLKVIDVYTGETLTKGTDYTLTYQNNKEVGTATIVITGIGNYTNSITVTFEIVDRPIKDGQQWFKLSGIVSPIVYTGSAITQKDAVVTDINTGIVLKEGVHYTLSYKNNIEVGTADIIATGVVGSDYEESVASSKFAIIKDDLDISDKIFVVDGIVSPKRYTGEEIYQDSLVVKDGNGKTLTEGVDYVISYKDNTEVGTAIVVITGIGDYVNIEVTETFEIISSHADYAFEVLGILSPMHYTGSEIYQDSLTVIDIFTGDILEENVDYKVTYKNNVNVGEATVVITGIGKYTGDTLRYFNIIKVPFMAFRVSGVHSPYKYTGSEIIQEDLEVRDYYTGRLLDPSEYEVYYDNNIDVTSYIEGPAIVKVVGKGKYEEAPPAIRAYAIFDENSVSFKYRVEGVESPIYYTGKEITQEKYIRVYDDKTNKLLEYGKDYTLAYLDNIEVGDATVAVLVKDTLGYGYEGIISADTFEIIDCNLVVTGVVSPKKYTGSEIYQNLVVRNKVTNELLVENVDYTVEYLNNTEVGTATVKVIGIGYYQGDVVTETFEIVSDVIDNNTNDNTKDNTNDDTDDDTDITPSGSGNQKPVEEIKPAPLYEPPYIFGYEDNTFRPESNITRAEVAQILYNINNVDDQDTSNIPYSDVDSNKWYAKAIAYCNRTNKMVGYEDGTFRPNDYITRAELVKAIFSIRDLSDNGKDVDLTDIDGHWAYDMIKKSYLNGVITGYPDKSFKPNADITRAETVSVVNRMLLRPNEWVLNREYVDLDENHWNYHAIMNASNGVKLEQ